MRSRAEPLVSITEARGDTCNVLLPLLILCFKQLANHKPSFHVSHVLLLSSSCNVSTLTQPFYTCGTVTTICDKYVTLKRNLLGGEKTKVLIPLRFAALALPFIMLGTDMLSIIIANGTNNMFHPTTPFHPHALLSIAQGQ